MITESTFMTILTIEGLCDAERVVALRRIALGSQDETVVLADVGYLSRLMALRQKLLSADQPDHHRAEVPDPLKEDAHIKRNELSIEAARQQLMFQNVPDAEWDRSEDLVTEVSDER